MPRISGLGARQIECVADAAENINASQFVPSAIGMRVTDGRPNV
jgi:hypothetical protein